MANEDNAQITYYEGLEELESLLSRVDRPGDFYVSGTLEVPMPRVEVEGVGLLSFPVPAEQISRLIRQAERAPFGRGEETILDESVRKVWQLPPGAVRISGKSWEQNFQTLLSHVTEGLGCGNAKVSAELYKLLVYDKGSFFLPHRDTEKAGGMFGTLVVVLPSVHRGGELLIRHAGREVRVDMSAAEISELSYAAFYADCEHEVKPIKEGNRVCLVYNLIQKSGRKESLIAPEHDKEIIAAAEMLKEALNEDDAPPKIAYLLEHQYSPAGLSFDDLKNADLARAQVLTSAAVQAGCAVHLGIVHIEEAGPAEVSYEPRGRYWGRGYDDDDEGEDFEIVEVSVSSQSIDQWINLEGERVDIGSIPLEEGELFPSDGMDGVEPDEKRVLEATGNEGASFERSYNRAALVIWRTERYPEVLLQAGIAAAFPYVKERVKESKASPASPQLRAEAIKVAGLLIDECSESRSYIYRSQRSEEPGRAEILAVLCDLGEPALVERFIAEVVIPGYDGSENAALVEATQLLGPAKSGALLCKLASENMATAHASCAELLSALLDCHSHTGKWGTSLREIATAAVGGLQSIGKTRDPSLGYDWDSYKKVTPVGPKLLASLLTSIKALKAEALRAETAAAVTERPKVFDPREVVLPALSTLAERQHGTLDGDSILVRLWQHTAEFLLARNEYPPEEPADWRQEAEIPCKCEDCKELKGFLSDPAAQVHRFRMRQDRRDHIQNTIKRLDLDMSFATDKSGSPQTLICTKTRRTYLAQCEQFRRDIRAFRRLLELLSKKDKEISRLCERMEAAVDRAE